MLIGNQPTSTAAQPRVRVTASSAGSAQAAPRFPVGRVAAFVQQINNGTFGSANGRAATALVKPTTFIGSPAKASATVAGIAPSAGRIPALPPLKSPALVLALTGIANRGGEEGAHSAPRPPSALPPVQAQTLRAMRTTSSARPRPTVAATTRLQRIATRALEGGRKPASPENYAGILRANPREIHPLAVPAGAQSPLPSSTDTAPHDGLSSGDSDWDVMSALEPFKERLERMEVAMHPAIVEEWQSSPPPCIELDGHEASDFDTDVESDFDSDFDEAFDTVEHAAQANVRAPGQESLAEAAEHRFMREGAEVLAAALKWARRDGHLAPPVVTATEDTTSGGQTDASGQLKLDVLRYRSGLEAFDQLPLAAKMAGVESLKSAVGKTASREQRPAFLDAVESFNRETLRKVGTVAEAPVSDVERSFGEGFAEMLKIHKESLFNHSNTDSGLESDSDADWGSDA